MAKLENVKVIDMVGGEITKVAYDGAEYVKVDDVKKGDIAVIVDAWSDLTNGEYYFVNYVSKWDDGDIFVGITRCRYLRYVGYDRNMNYFRKVSTETSLDITSIDERVDSLEKRVDALEEKPAQKLKAGNFVTIDLSKADADDGDAEVYFDSTDLTPEKTYEVRADDDGELYFIDDAGDKRTNPINSKGAYTIVKKPESPKPTFKTGDIVVITGNGDIGHFSKHHFEIGELVRVDIASENTVKGDRFRGESLLTEDYWYVHNSYARHATPAEREQYEANLKQAEKDAVFTKIGRKPYEFKKGDIVRVIRGGYRELKDGDIGIVVKDEIDDCPKVTVGANTHYAYAELITPVESRLDLKAGA